MQAELLIKVLDKNLKDLVTPKKGSAEAAGFDLVAAAPEKITLKPGDRHLVATGIAMAMPAGFEAQVRPRSGLAIKHGLTLLNSPGTIDSDYRGEVKVILANLGQEEFVITQGMRIAQLVISQLCPVSLSVVDDLPESVRGAGGFGSTGV